MVFSLLLAAVIWNLGTWRLGLPASSSHTLIGSVLGVGLAASFGSASGFGSGVNWAKAGQVLLSLIFSPFVGFVAAAALLWIAQRVLKHRQLHEPPPPGAKPPMSVRAAMIAACTGVSFAHGSNDGQKGVGLIMLILIGIVPAGYALDLKASPEQVASVVAAIDRLDAALASPMVAGASASAAPIRVRSEEALEWRHVRLSPESAPSDAQGLRAELAVLRGHLVGIHGLDAIPEDHRWVMRGRILRVRQALRDYDAYYSGSVPPAAMTDLRDAADQLAHLTEYAPTWVPIGVAVALGLGTMVGWKRIVVTVGEKIGKTPMTYAQGASAQLVTAGTILLADVVGAPVSTTHVLSSGIAGSMAAGGSGLQPATLKSIALAWLFTLPASMCLGALIFAIAHALLG